MKQKIFVTLFVFAICLAVLGVFHSRPISMDNRFKGIAYEQDAELESGITLRLTGELKESLFQTPTFTGTLSITSDLYPYVFDNITLSFNKEGITEYTLMYQDKEFARLRVTDDFETITLHITNSEFTDGKSVYIGAPATNLTQGQSIVNDLFY